MSTSKYFHIVMPALFFTAAVVAGILMEVAFGKNLDHTFRQLLFQQPGPSHSAAVVAWFGTAVTCFVLGVVYTWKIAVRRTSRPHRTPRLRRGFISEIELLAV
jgi:hypothetical protein